MQSRAGRFNGYCSNHERSVRDTLLSMMNWHRVVDFRFVLPDKPGELAGLAARLRQADINVIGLWGNGASSSSAAGAEFYCVPESADQFRNFADSAELNAREGQTYFIVGSAESATLTQALEHIAAAGINLVAIQGVQLAGEFGCFIWTHPRDWARLEQALGAPA